MKRFGKIISAILTAAMLLALLPAGMIVRAESGTCGDNLTWTLENGVLTISGTGQMRSDKPWGYDADIRSIVLEEGVENTAMSVFSYYTALTSVTIPSSLTHIGDGTFSDCTALESIVIPEGVTNIGEYAFHGCTSLKSVTLPRSLTRIGYRAFTYSTNNIIYNNLPGVQLYVYENSYAYSYAKSNNLNYVLMFSPMSGTCGDNLSFVLDDEAVLTISGSGDMYDYRDSIQSVKKGPWGNWPKSVTIGEGVTSIGSNAFYRCENMTSVMIPDSVTRIGSGAFCNCTGLTNVAIPNGVTSIGDNAFEGCTGLTSVAIPNSVTSIGDNAFNGCTGLTSVTIPNSVTSIGYLAFASCSGLKSVTIPLSVTRIGVLVFEGCPDVTLKVYENSVAHQYAIENNIPFELITLEKGDPDGDGEITVSDALAALRVAAKLAEPTPVLLACCDIDGDGEISVSDALSILRVAAKLADTL